MEIEVTWGNALRVWWAYLWRALVAAVVAMIAGGIVGGVIGFVMGALGGSISTIQLIIMPIGALIGLALSVVPIKMILGKDFGTFRLVLVAKEPL